MRTVKVRPIANEICDLFEELLDEHGIDIPNEDRDMEMEDMDEEEIEDAGFAHLYGTDYYNLEDAISELLIKFAKEIDPDGNVKLDDEF